MQPLPRNVIALGTVSFLMAVSSQMTHSLLPVYLVTVLGASAASVGFIEGVAGATNSLARVVSGTVSDWLGRRKPLVVAGYTLSMCAKPLFPLAGDVGTVLLARFLDRCGKGIRDAPRDALLADQLRPRERGPGFGLRLTLFTLGTVAGPLAATAAMLASGGDFQLTFWIAVIPAMLSVAVLVFAVVEPAGARAGNVAGRRISMRGLAQMPAAFWWVVSIAAMIELARCGQAFVLLKAREVGVETTMVPTFLVLMGLAYGLAAYPCGMFADRIARRWQLAIGVTILAASHGVFAASSAPAGAATGAILWGLQMGVVQGLLMVCVADTAPEHLRGTAFGIYYLVDGISVLIASSAAGWVWTAYGSTWAFAAGAILAAAVLLMILARPLPEARPPESPESTQSPGTAGPGGALR